MCFFTVMIITLLTQILMTTTEVIFDYEAIKLKKWTDFLDHPYVLAMYILVTTLNVAISMFNLFYAEKLIRLSSQTTLRK